MTSRKRTLVVVAGALAGLLVLLAIAMRVVVSKTRLETAVSEALGMQVAIGGRARVGFFPSLHCTLEDVHLRNRGTDLISAERADVGIDPLALLVLNVRIRKIEVERYRISIERSPEGTYNYEPEDPEKMLPALDLADASFSNGIVDYADRGSGTGFGARDCNLAVSHLSHPGGKPADLLAKLSITMKFGCAGLQQDDLVLADLRGSLDGRDGVFEFDPLTLRAFGGQGSGSIRVDHSGSVPDVHTRFALPQFQLEEFLAGVSPEKVVHGPVDLTMELTMQGSTWKELMQTADGQISLVGKDLALDGMNIDKELARYEASQHFNLVDAGALFLAGPLGMAVTKGYGFASLFRGSGGSTRIPTLVSHWGVERGIAHAKDVALTTRENRLALRGGLDLVNEEFDDVVVAVLDADGCVKVRQRITGSFQKPVVEKPHFLKSMAGPAIKLFKQVRKLFPGKECEVFYAGSVAQPAPPAKKR